MSSNLLAQLSILNPEFKWVIDIEKFNSYQKGKAIDSPTFFINNAIKNMQVWLYPKGEERSKEGNIAIFLWNHSIFDLTLDYGFSLLNNDDEKVNKSELKNVKIKSNRGHGLTDFVLESFVFDPANKLIKDGKITIILNIYENSATVRTSVMNENKNDLKDKNKKLFTNKIFSDVTIKSNGKEFQLHKCILANSSSVFEAMLQADMVEKDKNIIEIDDFDPEVLHQFFEYLYTNTVDNLEEVAKDLISVAEKYLVTDLKEKCEETMSCYIKIENAIEYFKLADLYNAKRLKKNATNFIFQNLAELRNSEELDNLSNVQLLEIIRG